MYSKHLLDISLEMINFWRRSHSRRLRMNG